MTPPAPSREASPKEVTYQQGEAWKGKFLIGLALRTLNDGINYIGHTAPGDPLTSEEYGKLREIEQELDDMFNLLMVRVKIP